MEKNSGTPGCPRGPGGQPVVQAFLPIPKVDCTIEGQHDKGQQEEDEVTWSGCDWWGLAWDRHGNEVSDEVSGDFSQQRTENKLEGNLFHGGRSCCLKNGLAATRLGEQERK
jgi:hypothetical protein